MKHSRINVAVAGIILLGLSVMADVGCANAQSRFNPSRRAAAEIAPAPATTRNSERLRTQLRGVHGFTRASLEAASTDVSAILRQFISDPGESVLVRRQAIKALRHYPSDGNFAFIRGNVNDAPEGLQRLYLHSLSGYTGARDAQIGAMLGRLLSSSAVGVRHAAVGLSGKLRLTASLRASLNSRLGLEQDPSVRSAIRRALSQQPPR